MAIFYKLAIDRVNTKYISGWCYHRFNKIKVVELQLHCNGRVVGETKADALREDVRELELHPTGNCGFEFIIDPPIEQNEQPECFISVKGSNHPLYKLDRKAHKRLFTGFAERARTMLGRSSLTGHRLVFMHIPKTAGTSFNTHVQSILPAKRIAIHLELENKKRYQELVKTKTYLSGHLRLGLLKKYFGNDSIEFYTIVREPYAHLHSHLNWLIKTASDESDNYFKYSNSVIYDLGKRLAAIDFSHLSDMVNFAENLDDVETQFFDNLQTRYFCDKKIQRVSGEDCRQAIMNTDTFRLIGTTENYTDFLRQFISRNNLPQIRKQGELNRSQADPLFDRTSKEVRDALYPLVRYDLLLYNHICDYTKGSDPVP